MILVLCGAGHIFGARMKKFSISILCDLALVLSTVWQSVFFIVVTQFDIFAFWVWIEKN